MKIKKIQVPENWKDLKPHPLSALCPYGAGLDTVALSDHMRQHGYDGNEPIVLFEDMVLEGRHRKIAASNADVVPTFAMFVGGNPIPYLYKKLLRQHLNESQRAMLAANLLKSTKDIADSDNAGIGENGKGANLPLTQKEAAAAVNVSARTMKDAAKVANEGGDALAQQVAAGQTKVSSAAKATRSVFCPRCDRCGPQRNCAKCQELRAKTALAERRKNPPVKPKKSGAPTFDWAAFKTHLGHVVRGVDAVKKAYPKLDEHIELDGLMDQFCKVWAKIQKKATAL